MSKQWALREQRLRKASCKKIPKTLPPPPQPVLSYTRLLYFQKSARAQHLPFSEPFSHLPDEVKEALEEEWWAIVDDTLKKMELEFYCGSCDKKHEVAGVQKHIDDLRSEMEKADVEIIDGNAVEKWNERLLVIKKGYWQDVQAIECGKAVQATVVEDAEIRSSTTTLGNQSNTVKHGGEDTLASTNNNTSNQNTGLLISTLSAEEIESNHMDTPISRLEKVLPHGINRKFAERIIAARKPKRKIQRLDAAYLKKILKTPKKTTQTNLK